MRWLAPPNRREISLVIFSVTIFTLAYNIENSFDHLELGSAFSRLGLGRSVPRVFGDDGRLPTARRDALEYNIFGEWGWDKGHMAADEGRRSQELGVGEFSAMWTGQEATGELGGKKFGRRSVDEGVVVWGSDIPQSTLVKYAPGYSILDNVILYKGTVYFISDDTNDLPAMSTIVTHTGANNHWSYISTERARDLLGEFGGIIDGVTWMSTDHNPHNSTLLSLWRTYSSLDPFIDESGRTTLPPPRRLIFPNVMFFSDPNPDFSEHWLRRRRTDVGFHHYHAKAAFPYLTMLYMQDWEDYHFMDVPFVIERIVVADRASAGGAASEGLPVFSLAFSHGVSKYWWEPVRRTLAKFFQSDHVASTKPVVTYIQPNRADMLQKDTQLVEALKTMGRRSGYEIQVVNAADASTGWSERMSAIVKSTIVLGVHGDDLMDGVYMPPSAHATIIELFPPGMFVPDREFLARSLGLRYVAMWGSQSFTGINLPPISNQQTQAMTVDSDAVTKIIHDILSSR